MIFLLPWIFESLNSLWNTLDWSKLANIAVILAGVIGYFRVVRPILRSLTAFFEDWFGERPRPGIIARPGIPSRMMMVESETDQLIRDNRMLKAEIKTIKAMITPIHTYVKDATGEIPTQRATRAESNR